MKKLILSVAVVGTALMGHGAEAQNIRKATERDLLRQKLDFLKQMDEVQQKIKEDEAEDSIDDSISGAVASQKLNSKIEAQIEDLDLMTAQISKLLSSSPESELACTHEDRKLSQQAQEQINAFVSNTNKVPLTPIVKRKRDKIKDFGKKIFGRCSN